MISSLCYISLFMMCVENWVDPPTPVSLEVSVNAAGPYQVGQEVEFSCTGHEHREESTLEWHRVAGDTETREQGGRSTLVHTRTLTAADHGASMYCGTWFFRDVNNNLETYYVRSASIPITIEGVTEEAKGLNTGGERLWLKGDPQKDSYEVGETVQWVCDQENISAGLVEMRQVKGNLERKLYVGYQWGYRWLMQELIESDKDTYIYCTVSIYNSANNRVYQLNGPPTYIH